MFPCPFSASSVVLKLMVVLNLFFELMIQKAINSARQEITFGTDHENYAEMHLSNWSNYFFWKCGQESGKALCLESNALLH